MSLPSVVTKTRREREGGESEERVGEEEGEGRRVREEEGEGREEC